MPTAKLKGHAQDLPPDPLNTQSVAFYEGSQLDGHVAAPDPITAEALRAINVSSSQWGNKRVGLCTLTAITLITMTTFALHEHLLDLPAPKLESRGLENTNTIDNTMCERFPTVFPEYFKAGPVCKAISDLRNERHANMSGRKLF